MLNLGDKLHRYVPLVGYFEYTVIGIRQNERGVQYEVRCDSCSHGWKCELLIAVNDYKKLAYVCMLNNDDEDDQKCFHNDLDYHFFPTLSAAKKDRKSKIIIDQKKRVEDAKAALKRAEDNLRTLEEMIC